MKSQIFTGQCGRHEELSYCAKPVNCQDQCYYRKNALRIFCPDVCETHCVCKEDFIRYNTCCISKGQCEILKKELSAADNI